MDRPAAAASPAPRARCRVLAGSSSSCHPWSTNLADWSVWSANGPATGEGHERADGHRRTLAPPGPHPWHAVARPWCRALRRARRRSAGRRDHARRPDRARHPGGRPGGRAGLFAHDGRDVSTSLGLGRPSSLRASAPCCLPTARMQPAFEAACGAAASTSAWSRRSGLARLRSAGAEVAFTVGMATCWWRRPARR